MSAFRRQLAALVMATATAACAHAAPTVTVSHLGLNDAGNREWLVDVAADPSLFAAGPQGVGGVVSAEFALEIAGAELVAVAKDATDWPLNTPGLNPFTGSVSSGLVVDLANDRAFAALTSRFLASGQATTMLRVETAGSGAVEFRWGGHDLLVGTPFQYVGSRFAQGAINFDGYQGLLTSPESSADFDGDGAVDGADFLVWQRGLQRGGLATRADGDADSDGMVDGVDLLQWKAQFGAVAASPADLLTVPEPSLLVMIAIGAAAWSASAASASSLCSCESVAGR